MVVTVLEADVLPDRAAALQAEYAATARAAFPPGLLRSRLLRSTTDPARWRIDTSWASLEVLAAMRAAGPPRGVQIFQAAGAEPTLSIYEVVAELAPGAGAA